MGSGQMTGRDEQRVSALDRPRLRGLLAEGVTVITPNRRLSRDLKRDFDGAQQASGRRVWTAADVLPWDAWLVRSFGEVEPDPNSALPALLSPVQQQTLWRQIVRESGATAGLLHADVLASTADQAWDLLQAEGKLADLGRTATNDEQAAFQGWVREFGRRLSLRAAISAAELPTWLAAALRSGSWKPARPILLAGFDRLTTRQRQLVDALGATGWVKDAPLDPTRPVARAVRIESADRRTQWQQVAAWVHARLARNPGARIGIVVPDLGAERDALVQALTDALLPSLRVWPRNDAVRPFNLSLGRPLAQEPLVATALVLFDLLGGALEVARVSSLLRSPFLAGGAPEEAEWARRARLDRALRDDGAWQVTLDRLRRRALRIDRDGIAHPDSAPQLGQALGRIAQRVAPLRTRRQPMPSWVTLLFDVLRDAGFPGTRTLDSVEYQAYQALRHTVAGLGSLDALLGPVTFSAALSEVRRAAADTLFQAESPDVPVQVLGVLEASHLEFDHLWVANLAEDRWPPEAQPNPLLPLALQRSWQLPSASAELSLMRAKQQMAGWAASSAELIYSHAALDGDRPCLRSPLTAAIAAQPFAALMAAEVTQVAAALKRGVALVSEVDAQAPELDAARAASIRGGTRLFADQSACPFRAFATHRLHASALVAPKPGLDASTRGRLLHDTLAAFWSGLGSQAALRALGDRALHERVVDAARAALDRLAQDQPDLLGQRLRDLEEERLRRAVHAWLDVEDARPPFTVESVEAQGEVDLAGLRVTVRPDRVDRLADGSLAIIDYKTGRVSMQSWLGERPDQPQLLLYATAYAAGMASGVPQPVGAIAFAQLRPGETKIVAVAAQEGLLTDARVVATDEVLIAQPGWSGLLEDWRVLLHRLARQFIAGDAAVAPKAGSTCTHCDLRLLCRRDERAALAVRLAERSTEEGDSD